ncbi:Asp23/Gls24 family envelope stress response protein [Pseudonocardia nematodicida]|uniref:Asp23/Gls24 family envelope stress response protein n=1 Tax=Pseudonocardia nematodicida TaxID=1206997 RepID=A0ABV1KFE3_9PSEU
MNGSGGTRRTRCLVSDLAVARVAARRARTVPGVTMLVGDVAQTLLGLAADWLPHDPVPDELRADGVVASVQGDVAEVRVTVGVRLGTPCADLAARVQREVAEEITTVTGLSARVRVTVADIALPA